MSEQLPILNVIIGPTAAGKTAYGIDMAKKLDGAVISADSRQIYAGMDIGTAKPEEAWQRPLHAPQTPDAVQGVPHYLFNIASPTEHITLPHWQASAFSVIDTALQEGRAPILVGGTMLYIDSVIFNYAIPEVPPDKTFRLAAAKKDTASLHRELLEKDPAAKSFIEPHHKQRIIRALEVMHATGKPFSAVRMAGKPKYKARIHGIFPGWDAMRRRIAKRVNDMLESDLLEETKQLQKTYGPDLPLLNTMNYKQAAGVLSGALSVSEATDKMVQVNMRYARRQMSWWRGRQDIEWITESV